MDRIFTMWSEFLARLKTYWVNQGRQTRMLIVGVIAAGVVALAISSLIYAVKRADYGTLFSNLPSEDAASIIQKLKDEKVPYELSDSGTTISIPADMVAEERVTLAGAGMVHGGGTGYELFDRMNFGMTEFEEKLDKTRAIEGELQRTIAALNPVQAARVHIASPDPSLYVTEQSPVTASIAVTTKPGMTLSPEEVRGIVQLVAGAVEGLKPDQVTIVNQDGVMLVADNQNTDSASSALRLTQDQLIAKGRYESQLQQNIQSLLDSTLGPKHVAVRVATDMNFDSETTKSDEFSNNPVIRSEQTEKEKYTGNGKPSASGVPGTTSNIGTYQAPQGGSGGNYSRSKVTRNYEINVIHRDHVNAPGRVNHTSVAVLVNTGSALPAGSTAPGASYQLSTANITQIRNIVIAAAGLNLLAGDQVSVEAIPFNPAVLAETSAAGTTTFLGLPIWAALAAAGILLLAVIGGIIAATRRAPLPALAEDHFASFDNSLQNDLVSIESRAESPHMFSNAMLNGPLMAPEDITREQMVEYVTAVAQEDPESIGKLVKIWLAE